MLNGGFCRENRVLSCSLVCRTGPSLLGISVTVKRGQWFALIIVECDYKCSLQSKDSEDGEVVFLAASDGDVMLGSKSHE